MAWAAACIGSNDIPYLTPDAMHWAFSYVLFRSLAPLCSSEV
jgi:hypothetical protein